MARIFISYARKDGSEIAEELADRLRAFEHNVFLDVHSIRAGTRWRFELRRRIAWADLMIVLVTPASNMSDHVREEIALAEKLNRPILPVQIEDTPTPDHLRSEWQIIPLKGGNYDRLLLELEHAFRLLPSRSFLPAFFLIVLAFLIVAIGLGVLLVSRGSLFPNSTPTFEEIISGSTSDDAGKVLVVDEDFEDQVVDNWFLQWGSDFKVIDDGTGNHVWSSTAEGEIYYEPSVEWHNYAFAVDFYVIDWDDENDTAVVIELRREPDQECNRYDFVLHPDHLVLGATDETCANFAFFNEDTDHPNTPGTWHRLYVAANGNQLQWQLDGGEMKTYNDDRRTIGSIGILNLQDTEIWFDSLRIWKFQ
jgi:hypothetical protein